MEVGEAGGGGAGVPLGGPPQAGVPVHTSGNLRTS